jgi:hypothetical protein
MSKDSKNNASRGLWTTESHPGDYRNAADYLSLVASLGAVPTLIQRLRDAPIVLARPTDLLRASGLHALGIEDGDVARDLKQIKRGKRLTPILCLRGDLRRDVALTIVDGYARLCASLVHDNDVEIPCRIAEPLEAAAAPYIDPGVTADQKFGSSWRP